MESITYATSGRSDYSSHITKCCGDSEHRPANSPGGNWFCMSCGRVRKDDPRAQKKK